VHMILSPMEFAAVGVLAFVTPPEFAASRSIWGYPSLGSAFWPLATPGLPACLGMLEAESVPTPVPLWSYLLSNFEIWSNRFSNRFTISASEGPSRPVIRA